MRSVEREAGAEQSLMRGGGGRAASSTLGLRLPASAPRLLLRYLARRQQEMTRRVRRRRRRLMMATPWTRSPSGVSSRNSGRLLLLLHRESWQRQSNLLT